MDSHCIIGPLHLHGDSGNCFSLYLRIQCNFSSNDSFPGIKRVAGQCL